MLKIIWDWNGTLLDDAALCLSCINRLLKRYELPELPDLQAYRQVFCFPVQHYYEKCGFDFSKHSWESLAGQYMDDYMSRWHQCSLTPTADQTLMEAKKCGFDNIILSASKLDNLKEQVSGLHLADVVDAVYGIGDIYAHSKLELAREMLQTCLPEDEIWCVGDSEHDAEIARNIHAGCILVTTGHQSRSKLEKAGCPVVDTPAQALALICSYKEEGKSPAGTWQQEPEGNFEQHVLKQERGFGR